MPSHSSGEACESHRTARGFLPLGGAKPGTYSPRESRHGHVAYGDIAVPLRVVAQCDRWDVADDWVLGPVRRPGQIRKPLLPIEGRSAPLGDLQRNRRGIACAGGLAWLAASHAAPAADD